LSEEEELTENKNNFGRRDALRNDKRNFKATVEVKKN
jgi:hypothetical protein